MVNKENIIFGLFKGVLPSRYFCLRVGHDVMMVGARAGELPGQQSDHWECAIHTCVSREGGGGVVSVYIIKMLGGIYSYFKRIINLKFMLAV